MFEESRPLVELPAGLDAQPAPGVTRLLSWNMNQRIAAWPHLVEVARAAHVDVALLQEAGQPRGQVLDEVATWPDKDDKISWRTQFYRYTGERRVWCSALASLRTPPGRSNPEQGTRLGEAKWPTPCPPPRGWTTRPQPWQPTSRILLSMKAMSCVLPFRSAVSNSPCSAAQFLVPSIREITAGLTLLGGLSSSSDPPRSVPMTHRTTNTKMTAPQPIAFFCELTDRPGAAGCCPPGASRADIEGSPSAPLWGASGVSARSDAVASSIDRPERISLSTSDAGAGLVSGGDGDTDGVVVEVGGSSSVRRSASSMGDPESTTMRHPAKYSGSTNNAPSGAVCTTCFGRSAAATVMVRRAASGVPGTVHGVGLDEAESRRSIDPDGEEGRRFVGTGVPALSSMPESRTARAVSTKAITTRRTSAYTVTGSTCGGPSLGLDWTPEP